MSSLSSRFAATFISCFRTTTIAAFAQPIVTVQALFVILETCRKTRSSCVELDRCRLRLRELCCACSETISAKDGILSLVLLGTSGTYVLAVFAEELFCGDCNVGEDGGCIVDEDDAADVIEL